MSTEQIKALAELTAAERECAIEVGLRRWGDSIGGTEAEEVARAIEDACRKKWCAALATPTGAQPVAWEYRNSYGNLFLTHKDPATWHPHDLAGFKDFSALGYIATKPEAQPLPVLQMTFEAWWEFRYKNIYQGWNRSIYREIWDAALRYVAQPLPAQPECHKCSGVRFLEEGDPEVGGIKVPCELCFPALQAQLAEEAALLAETEDRLLNWQAMIGDEHGEHAGLHDLLGADNLACLVDAVCAPFTRDDTEHGKEYFEADAARSQIAVLRAELEQVRHMLAEERADLEAVTNRAAELQQHFYLADHATATAQIAATSERGRQQGMQQERSTEQAERKPQAAHCSVCNGVYGSCGHCG